MLIISDIRGIAYFVFFFICTKKERGKLLSLITFKKACVLAFLLRDVVRKDASPLRLFFGTQHTTYVEKL